MSSKLTERIRQIREAETSGRAEFSQLIGVPKKTLENIELTGRAPKGEMLEAICQHWPKYTLWLMTGETDKLAGQISPQDQFVTVDEDENGYLGKYSLIEIRDLLKKAAKETGFDSKKLAIETGLNELDIDSFFKRKNVGGISKEKEIEIKLYIFLKHRDFIDISLLKDVYNISYTGHKLLPG